jgi:hypothetical protein
MTWRILIEPAYFNNDPTDTAGAEGTVPLGASDADVDAVADKWAWQLPLGIWTPSETDPRFLRLVKRLEEEHNMDRETDIRVYIKELQCLEK